MRKAFRTLLSVVSSVILVLVTVPVAVWLLMLLEPVQNFVVRQASVLASDKLETTVSFDRVRIKLFNSVEMEGFHVADHEGDTLLYAAHLSADFNPVAMLSGRFSFGDVALVGGRFNLKQYADGTSNLKRVLDRLKRAEPRPRKLFRMDVRRIALSDMRFTMRRHTVRERPYGVNFDDMDISHIDLAARGFAIVGDSISLRIDRMSLVEKSGLRIDGLSSRGVGISGGGIVLDELSIRAPGSDVLMPHMRMTYGSWQDFRDFTDLVQIDSEIEDSKVSASTVAFFAPGMRGWDVTLIGVDARVGGTVAAFTGELSGVGVGNSSHLAMRFAVDGLPDVAGARFSVHVSDLDTDFADLSAVMAGVGAAPLGPAEAERLRSLGAIHATADFKGRLSEFDLNGDVETDLGRASAAVKLSRADGGSTFAGSASVDGFDFGRLVGGGAPRAMTARADLDGAFGTQGVDAKGTMEIARAAWRGYDYHDITVSGRFAADRFSGQVHSPDPNVDFDFDGVVDLSGDVPRYDFALDLRGADLAALGVNRRDSVSLLRARLDAKGSGLTLDELNATIDITDLLYVNHLDSVRTGPIRITGRNSEQSKYLGLASSFADAEFRSKMSYDRMLEYLTRSLYSYLPSLSEGGARTAPGVSAAASDPNNYSVLSVSVKEANNVAGIFLPGFIVAKDSRLSFTFNPDAGNFSAMLASQYIERGESFVSNLEVNSRNRGDSLSLFVRADEIYAGGFLVPDFSVIAGARQNRITASARFADAARDVSALVGATLTLGRDTLTGMPRAEIRTSPSSFTMGSARWNIFTRGITVDSTRVAVDNFTVTGSGQSLRVDGAVSHDPADTLHVSIANFDLSPLSQATARMGYEVGGRTTGRADLFRAEGNTIMRAGIDFDSVRVNDVAVPPTRFESAWDFQGRRARFFLTKRHDAAGTVLPGDTLATMLLQPATGNYMGSVRMDGVDLSLLDPLLSGVVAGTRGRADVAATVTGNGRRPEVNGTVKVRELDTRIDFLKVPYSLAGNDITIDRNVLRLTGGNLTDRAGNRAAVDMTVDLGSLSNIAYRLDIAPRNLLVLNTTQADNDLFYGRVFASGRATVSGDRRGVDMNIAATTAGASEFYMPMSDKTDMGEVDFINYIRDEAASADTTEYLVRKRMILEGNRRVRAEAAASNMNIRMSLGVGTNTSVELLIDPQTGHTIRGRGNGSLTLDINPRGDIFSMYGDYQLTEGTYFFTLENLINKPFTIEQGSNIQWTGDPLDALLDITAVHGVRTSIAPVMRAMGQTSNSDESVGRIPVECRIFVTDRLSRPLVSFNVTAPGAGTETQNKLAAFLSTQEMMATQFFFLVAAGSFYNSADINMEDVGSTVAFDILSNQLSNWISSDRFNIGIRYSPRTTDTSDEVGIDFSQPLLGDRLLIEVEGNYDAGNNINMIDEGNFKNFTGDFYLTWLMDRAGDLRTKIFSRTIDLYNEYQGLQEYGVGLYFNEDFDKFGDVLRGMRERFSARYRRQRQAQRLLRREMEDAVENERTEEKAGESEREQRITIENTDEQTNQ